MTQNAAGSGYHNPREEVLEQIWRLEEEGQATEAVVAEVMQSLHTEGTREALEALKSEGILIVDGETFRLSEEGRVTARRIVRANRLAARLLTDLLELPQSLVETQACRLEHAISPLLADRLCTLMGHPPTAPDGSPIPPGPCCQDATTELTPAVHPITELNIGGTGRIIFIRPAQAERLNQLSSLGLVPGTLVRLTQRRPSLVVHMGESTLALEHVVGRDIFVKPL